MPGRKMKCRHMWHSVNFVSTIRVDDPDITHVTVILNHVSPTATSGTPVDGPSRQGRLHTSTRKWTTVGMGPLPQYRSAASIPRTLFSG